MERREFNIGPGATSLILIAVVLCMSALSMLGLVNARNDIRLSERAVSVAEHVSALYDHSERSMAKLDALVTLWEGDAQAEDMSALGAVLPEGMTLYGDVVRWVEHDGDGQELQCAVKICSMKETPRLVWIEHALVTDYVEMEPEAIWN